MADTSKTISYVQNILGGPYIDPTGRTVQINQDSAELDPFGESSNEEFPESTPETFSESRDRLAGDNAPQVNRGDGSQGGSNIPDPAEPPKASADAMQQPPGSTGASSGTHPEIRRFDDNLFILMHTYNLVNLRNEKLNFEIEEQEQDKEDNDADGSPDGVVANTIRSLKSPSPYAYLPTDQQPKETNATIQCIGEPAAFMNYMTASPAYQEHIDSTTSQLSKMTSKIRLFKLFMKDDTEEVVEFAFETAGMGAAELETLKSSRGKKRGYGVGLKSFSMTFDGKYQGNMSTTVVGQLVIYAESMEEMFRVRTGLGQSSDLEYRFADLSNNMRGTNKNTGIKKGDAEDTDFQIIADVGIAGTNNSVGRSADGSSMTIKLNPIGHDYTFGQDGSVTITIEFAGSVSEIFENLVNFDIFASKKSHTKTCFKDLSRIILEKNPEESWATDLKQKISSIGNSDYKSRITSITRTLRSRGKIYYIRISDDVMVAYNEVFNSYEKNAAASSTSPQFLPSAIEARINDGLKILQGALGTMVPSTSDEGDTGLASRLNVSSVEANEKQASEMQDDMEEKKPSQSTIRDCALDPNSNQVAYFYVGDLINLILENMSDILSDGGIEDISRESLEMFESFTAVSKEEAAQLETMGLRAAGIVETNLDEVNSFMVTRRSNYKKTAARFKKLRVVLGPTSVTDYFSNKQIVCSIGDLPIPLIRFTSWLSGKMEGSKRNEYPLSQFLDDFLTQFLQLSLKGDQSAGDTLAVNGNKEYNRSHWFGHNSGYKEYDTDPLTLLRRSDSDAAGRKSLLYEFIPQDYRPLIKLNSDRLLERSLRHSYDYMVFFEDQSELLLPYTIGEMGNLGVGIYQLGKDRGILQEIAFQRQPMAIRKTNLMLDGDYGNLTNYKELFHATMKLYANLNIHNGQYLYIDPESIVTYLSKETREKMGPFSVQALGMGGWFSVIKTSHTFEAGRFETNLDLSWMADPYNYAETQARRDDEISESPDLAGDVSNPNMTDNEREARAVSDKFFGGVVQSIVGLFKAYFDNSHTGLHLNLTGQDGVDLSSAGSPSNPDQGNQNSANNGPRD